MHALKTPIFHRSRLNSPAPVSIDVPGGGMHRPEAILEEHNRVSRPMSRISLPSFRKSTPSSLSKPAANPPFTVLVQDGTYLNTLSLRLSEAVSRALVQPTVPAEVTGGRKSLPAGRGFFVGQIINNELEAAQSKAALQKAIIRTIQRPLSVLFANLSSQLLPVLSNPEMNLVMGHTQLVAISLARVASEVLATFERYNLGTTADPRGIDTLRNTREGLSNLLARTVDAIVASIKTELLTHINWFQVQAQGKSPPSASNATPKQTYQSQVNSLISLIVQRNKDLARLAELASAQTERATASLVIALIWRSLVIFAQMRSPSSATANVSRKVPTSSPEASRKLRLGTPTTPPGTPASRFAIKLPQSRPPSPPGASQITPAGILRVLLGSIRAVMPLTPSNPLAKEAVDEAIAAMTALPLLLEQEAAGTLLVASEDGQGNDHRLDATNKDIPTLIALIVLLRNVPPLVAEVNEEHPDIDTSVLAKAVGMGPEFDEACLASFSRSDECEDVVSMSVLARIRAYNTCATSRQIEDWLVRRLEEED